MGWNNRTSPGLADERAAAGGIEGHSMWKARIRWIAGSLLLLPATNLAFSSLGAVAFHPEPYTWGEAVADVTFTALYLMTVFMAPGTVLYLLVLAWPGSRLRVASRRALAFLLSPILGAPLLYGFRELDTPWLLLLWLGPSLAYALGLQWRLAGIPGARSRELHSTQSAPPPGKASRP
jgi:hypothetical protein